MLPYKVLSTLLLKVRKVQSTQRRGRASNGIARREAGGLASTSNHEGDSWIYRQDFVAPG